MSSSLATSVTPDNPRRDNNSITEMALSTDCTEGLLRATAHISADPTPPSVSWLDPPVSRCGLLVGLHRGTAATRTSLCLPSWKRSEDDRPAAPPVGSTAVPWPAP